MIIGRAKCQWCGYVTSTGGILRHYKECSKNPDNIKRQKAHPIEVPNSDTSAGNQKSESNSKPISEGEQKSAEEILKKHIVIINNGKRSHYEWPNYNTFLDAIIAAMQEYANQFKKEGEQLYRFTKASKKLPNNNLLWRIRYSEHGTKTIEPDNYNYDDETITLISSGDKYLRTNLEWLEPIQGE